MEIKKYKDKLNQEKIDTSIIALDAFSIINIYGGVTYKSLEERKNEHINADEIFKNMDILEILNMSSKSEARKAESYLVNKLNEKFGNKCINSRNYNIIIKHPGGLSLKSNQKTYRIYVMFNKN